MDINKRQILILFLGMIAVKAALLLAYGPIYTPDSAGYTAFADRIINETAWRTYVDLNDYWYPDTAFRSIGYPAVIAFFKLVFGGAFDWLLVISQICFSLYISWLVYVLSFEVSKRTWIAVITSLSHGLGIGLLLDQCMLTDSLNANLLLLMLGGIALKIVRKEQPSLLFILGCGGLLALAFFIREAGQQLQYLYWIPLIYWFVVSRAGLKKSVIYLVAFTMPISLSIYGYKSWNEMRTGERFVTTAGQTSMFFPALELKKRGINGFEDDPYLHDIPPYREPLDQIAPLKNINIINHHLVTEHGMNAYDMSKYSFLKFKDFWVTYPVDMLLVTLSHIREKQAFLAFRPFESMMNVDFWATGIKPFYKKQDLFEKIKANSRYDLLVAYIGRHLSRILSIVITVSFVFAVPFFALRELWKNRFSFNAADPNYMLVFVLWLVYFGFTSAYAMVSLEMRYLMPVVPFSTLAGLLFLMGPVEKIWAKACSLKNRGMK